MGRSLTVHCVGYGNKYVYTAMNRVEVTQNIAKARGRGDDIIYWIAQTKTGMRILKTDYIGQEKYTKDLTLPKLVKCPICEGTGILSKEDEGDYKVVHPCPVCNGSGICKKGNEKNWSEWQIEEFRKEYREYKSNLGKN